MEENLIGNSFTWFKQFNAQIAEMTEEEQFAFIPEVVLWAAFGREPSFMDAKGDQTARYMKQAFLGMKSSLDSSIKSQNRNTGGAPKKKKASGKKKGTGDDNPPTEPHSETPLNNPPAEPPSITPLQNLRKDKTRKDKTRKEKRIQSIVFPSMSEGFERGASWRGTSRVHAQPERRIHREP